MANVATPGHAVPQPKPKYCPDGYRRCPVCNRLTFGALGSGPCDRCRYVEAQKDVRTPIGRQRAEKRLDGRVRVTISEAGIQKVAGRLSMNTFVPIVSKCTRCGRKFQQEDSGKLKKTCFICRGAEVVER